MVVLNPMVTVFERAEVWENYSFFQRYGRKERHWTSQRYFPAQLAGLHRVGAFPFKPRTTLIYGSLLLVFMYKNLFRDSESWAIDLSKCSNILLVLGSKPELLAAQFTQSLDLATFPRVTEETLRSSEFRTHFKQLFGEPWEVKGACVVGVRARIEEDEAEALRLVERAYNQGCQNVRVNFVTFHDLKQQLRSELAESSLSAEVGSDFSLFPDVRTFIQDLDKAFPDICYLAI